MSIAEQCVYAIGSLGGQATRAQVARFFEANGDGVHPYELGSALTSLAANWRPPALERADDQRGRGHPATWRLTERGRRMISDGDDA